MELRVTKRDGKKAPLDINKIHAVVERACEGLRDVSPSEIEFKANLSFFDGIQTRAIQEELINAAASLISESVPEYQMVAGRLVNYQLRKELYDSETPPSLLDHIKKTVALGFYDKDILTNYSEEEINLLDTVIDHDADYTIPYAGMEQYRSKYLAKDRSTKRIVETPQFALMCISMTLFSREKTNRLGWVKEYYKALAAGDFSLPTPQMAGVRTPQKQYSSCVLIESGDSLDSIFSTATAIGKHVSQKAGIGIGASRLRAEFSKIRNGDSVHTGVVPFYRLWESATKSCSQGGVRGGAATLNYAWWHMDVMNMIPLKNNKGTEMNRVRRMDYCLQLNNYVLRQYVMKQDVYLFSPSDVPEVTDSFYKGAAAFEEAYKKAVERAKAGKIRSVVMPAKELLEAAFLERLSTGRLYLMNVDAVNEQGSFLVPVRMTNLCTEITLPTEPFESWPSDPVGEIALCILAAINLGRVKTDSDFDRIAALVVRGLDNLIDIQHYITPMAERSARERRPLGIGVNNFSYWMTKNGHSYNNPSPEDLRAVDELFEKFSFYLIKASVELAEERGACSKNHETKYSRGITPNMIYNRRVDNLVEHEERHDWQMIRDKLVTTGIRNSTLMALMPSETSSQVLPLPGSTNGMEPPKSLIVGKGGKDGSWPHVVPELRKLKKSYEMRFSTPTPEGYLKVMAVAQKYVDQAISVNTSYDPSAFAGEMIPMTAIVSDILTFFAHGGKNLYYNNVDDMSGEVKVHAAEATEADIDEESCSSCVI